VTDVLRIAECFETEGRPIRGAVHGRGHINTTFLIETDHGIHYILQRINEQVFPEPWTVVANTARVIAHVEARAPGLVPAQIPARDGKAGHATAAGVWRMLAFVEDAEPGVVPLELSAARAAGEVFGRFQAALADYDLTRHAAPIPGFLEIAPWLARLDTALSAGDRRRRRRAGHVVAGIAARRDVLVSAERGPVGVIHADGKVNNVLFERGTVEQGQARPKAVIDLDTVMVGPRAWDFGDLVRSAAASGEEDAPGLSMNLDRFEALAAGFAAGLGALFDDGLRGAMITAPRYITLTLATRFLVDYLEGDRYFRVDDDSHNLRRASAQLSLAASEEALTSDMIRVLERLP